MGMSASQARLLTITSRMSDLELQAQNITNNKIRLSMKSQEIAQNYSDALNNKKLVFNKTDISVTANNLTSYNKDSLDVQRILKDSSGRVVVSQSIIDAFNVDPNHVSSFCHNLQPPVKISADDEAVPGEFDLAKFKHYFNLWSQLRDCGYNIQSDANLNNSDWLQEQLSNGNLMIAQMKSNAWYGANGAPFTHSVFDTISYSSDTSLVEELDESDDAAAEAEYKVKTAELQAKDKIMDNELNQIQTEHKALETEYDSVKKVIEKNIEKTFKIFG
ncbi:MAG TPA: hypothetical protein PLG15_01225 [Candidatus Gastranaerophilaceae bacterium]|nr:hypothetical protein [Candidatus Gastranaerophilaceae bacterium]HPT40989.1 hypothetical protein [Candidatus Gastranaerophilaceae bacterium]